MRSRSGCKIQARNLRAPIGVTVRSSAAQQTRVARAARFDQLEIRLRGGIEQDVIRRRIAAQRREMVDFAPQLML